MVTAIAQQNVRWRPGKSASPVPRGQQFQLTINTKGRLSEAEEFQDIVVKVGAGAQATTVTSSANTTVTDLEALSTGIVRLRDVVTRYPDAPGDPNSGMPKVDLMAQQYDTSCTLNGKQSVALSVYQLPGSNAMAVSQKVRATMKELSRSFPEGLRYEIVYDTTPFIRESVNEVFKTLRDAVILVAIVVLLFLQDWRAMILPMIDVPVSLIGTFAVMAMLGFTLNNLTLFGLVPPSASSWMTRSWSGEHRTADRHRMDALGHHSRRWRKSPAPSWRSRWCFAVFIPGLFPRRHHGQFFRQLPSPSRYRQ